MAHNGPCVAGHVPRQRAMDDIDRHTKIVRTDLDLAIALDILPALLLQRANSAVAEHGDP